MNETRCRLYETIEMLITGRKIIFSVTMTGLEELGIPGGNYLQDALTNCSDPLAAIEEFLTENGILLPSLQPALPFLDLHGIRRLDFHSSVLEELREKLLQKITELANGIDKERYQKLTTLLGKCFPVVKVKTLQPVVMCIMKHLPTIDKNYLSKILDDRELYAEASTEVKRQIWQDNQALFGDEVSPLLSQYIKDKDQALLNHENSSLSFFVPTPKFRRQGEVVQKLVNMIGKNVKLYDMVLQFLRTLFLRTRTMHYCSLRAELLMALHDLEVHEVCTVDPCHKFTWCVDACVRERFVDSKRSRELQGFLDGIKKGQEQVLGDLSMILCDPFAINTITLSLIKALQSCVNTETLPRDSIDLMLLVRMLALGTGAWDMIDSQSFKEPKLVPPMFTRFLPYIIAMFVDDQYRSIAMRLSDDHHPVAKQPSELYAAFIQDSIIASMIAMYYTLQVTRQKDRLAVTQILPTLIHCENDIAYDDTFLHSLVSYLIGMNDDFSHDEFCVAVFDDFLLPGICHENILRHVMRLLWHVHYRLPAARLQAIMDILQPTKEHSVITNATYSLLSDKISSYQPSPTAPEQKMDSPLMSVPAPTPLHT